MQFMGIWLSEGCISKSRDGVIKISQNDGDVAVQIREMLDSMGVYYTQTIQNKKNVHITFHIRDVRLYEYLKPLGDCYTKYIPHELKQLAPVYLEELLHWFALGDGRIQRYRNAHTVRINVFSVSKRLIEDLHECLIKSGGNGNWTVHESKEDYMFAEHLIKVENKQPLYQLNISQVDGIYLDERFLTIEPVEHNDNVYCITVENSNFCMKENNKCFWTGNSPTINLDRVSHIITELNMDGDVGIGCAKVLDTPMGKIVQSLIDGGVQLGMSTRGVGTLNGDVVGDDYKLITVDIVADPSAPTAFVEGVLENKEYIVSETGEIVESAIAKLKSNVDGAVNRNRFNRKEFSNETLEYLNEFLDSFK